MAAYQPRETELTSHQSYVYSKDPTHHHKAVAGGIGGKANVVVIHRLAITFSKISFNKVSVRVLKQSRLYFCDQRICRFAALSRPLPPTRLGLWPNRERKLLPNLNAGLLVFREGVHYFYELLVRVRAGRCSSPVPERMRSARLLWCNTVVSSSREPPSYLHRTGATQCKLSAFNKQLMYYQQPYVQDQYAFNKGCPKCLYLISLFISVPR
ncbi:hypothetical protein J6590_069826 [Homalodisca vitripennis]|nr:hypothetical protein J6590_069826 [Homalodisca vitripennis]